MTTTTSRCLLLLLLIFSVPLIARSQESVARAQAEVARGLETAARNQEEAARLATESPMAGASDRAQAAALRAQDAANRAQTAANQAQAAADVDASSMAAQSAALNAQESANRAQENANRAQEAANRAQAPAPGSDNRARPSDNQRQGQDGESSRGIPRNTENASSGSQRPAPTESNRSIEPVAMTSAPPPANNSGRTTSPAPATPAAGDEDFDEFINRRVLEITKSRLGPKNNTNQSEAPSLSANSTSLVDKSSVGDLITLATNPSGTTSGASNGGATSSSVTVTAYAFKAFASGRDPLDPSYYNSNRSWRKFSFTYGYDHAPVKPGGPQEKGNIYGVKFLPYDKRDVSDPGNETEVKSVSDFLKQRAPSLLRARHEIEDALFTLLQKRGKLPNGVTTSDAFLNYIANDDKFATDMTALLGDDMKVIDQIISNYIDPNVQFTKAVQDAFDSVRRKPQVAVLFLTKQRKGEGPNDYMGGLTMDLGVAQRWNLTFNGTINHTDNKVKTDSTGGSFAAELQIPLTVVDRLGARVPWAFSFAASGHWMTKEGPRYQGQAKLTIPVPHMPGVELPISVSFANRSELLAGKESKVSGHIGFTFDLARLLTAFKNQVVP